MEKEKVNPTLTISAKDAGDGQVRVTIEGEGPIPATTGMLLLFVETYFKKLNDDEKIPKEQIARLKKMFVLGTCNALGIKLEIEQAPAEAPGGSLA